MEQSQLISAVKQNQIEWSAHALRRMLERSISREAIKYIICAGEIIEDYPDDKFFPSVLISGMWRNKPLHTVVAYDISSCKAFVVTAYIPDDEHFKSDFKTRKLK